ncbi:MAG TPA: hypothetical protein VGW39_08995 [Chthoniobacterales bacterium]|nr:hypothetical protein [Chthoniobacterales bacterium]
MFKRLVIISCCALGGFAFGRWLSPPADASAASAPAAERRLADLQAAAPIELPPPERAGRVPFVEVYRSLRSSSTEERIAYLHSLQKLPDGPDRRAALTAFFQCMASIDPQKAVDLVRQVGKDDLERTVLAVLGATSAAYTPDLVKMLLDLPDLDPKWREEKLNGQMFFWAALDPAAAAQFADEYQRIYPDLAASGIVQCLAAADPAAAERWLKEHPDLRKKPEIMSDYLKGLYQDDPASARRYLTEHATDEAVQPSLKGVARLTFLSSADDAAEFISHLPTKEARQAALDGILDTNIDLFANSETSRTALCEGLAEWVTKFSPDDWPATMSRFIDQWRELDPDGSVSWMARLPSPTRSAIAVEFVRHLAGDELKQFLATTAGDFRHDVLTAVAENLSEAPADARKAVIEALELPPEDAAQLAAIVR